MDGITMSTKGMTHNLHPSTSMPALRMWIPTERSFKRAWLSLMSCYHSDNQTEEHKIRQMLALSPYRHNGGYLTFVSCGQRNRMVEHVHKGDVIHVMVLASLNNRRYMLPDGTVMHYHQFSIYSFWALYTMLLSFRVYHGNS